MRIFAWCIGSIALLLSAAVTLADDPPTVLTTNPAMEESKFVAKGAYGGGNGKQSSFSRGIGASTSARGRVKNNDGVGTLTLPDDVAIPATGSHSFFCKSAAQQPHDHMATLTYDIEGELGLSLKAGATGDATISLETRLELERLCVPTDAGLVTIATEMMKINVTVVDGDITVTIDPASTFTVDANDEKNGKLTFASTLDKTDQMDMCCFTTEATYLFT